MNGNDTVSSLTQDEIIKTVEVQTKGNRNEDVNGKLILLSSVTFLLSSVT
jgi:hypothetical protein